MKKIDNEVVRYYNHGLNDSQIAKKIGLSVSRVNTIRLSLGLDKQLTPKQRQVSELRKQGKCSYEICDLLGIERKEVKRIARSIGMPFTQAEIDKSKQLGAEKSILHQYGTTDERIQHSADYIRQYHPEFIHVSGFIASDGSIELQCGECGNKVIKSAGTIRKRRKIRCPYCYEQQQRQKREQAEQEKQQQRQKQEEEKNRRFWEQNFKQLTFQWKSCPECGCFFVGRNKYCSDECRRKSQNRRSDKRIRKYYKKTNTDITLKKLYKRDKGICYLCGGLCDYDDCSTDEKGNFIVGKNYSSIDHIYPLSKGGRHSWDNIKLAHFYCNTIKRDKVVS